MKDLKLPPHSIEAEESVLGGIMLDQDIFSEVAEIITDKDFFARQNREIFLAFHSLHAQMKPIDVITVSDFLKARESDVDLAYLGDISMNTPSSANVLAYAEIVKERSVLRKFIQASNEISSLAYRPEGKSIEDLANIAETKLMAVTRDNVISDSGLISITEAYKKLVQRTERASQSKNGITGLATGFFDLDRITSGLQPADLVIIAGRPSMGKTCISMNIAEHIAYNNPYPVLVFSLEMSADSLLQRHIASTAVLNFDNVRKGRFDNQDDWAKYNAVINKDLECKPFEFGEQAKTTMEMQSCTRKVIKDRGGVSAILVDYLQLMDSPKGENRTQEIGQISRGLKALAKEFNVPVIALSQLNRSLEQRSNKRPVMSDLRESGDIEQDADLILFVYRDEVYNEDSFDNKGKAELIIRKHRNGELGTVHLGFQGQYQRFVNLINQDESYGY